MSDSAILGLPSLPPTMNFPFGRRLRAYLPLSNDDLEKEPASHKRRPPLLRITQKRSLYILLFVIFVNIAFFYHTGRLQGRIPFQRYKSLNEIWAMEAAMPQHNADLPSPEGRDGRYIRFRNQMWGVGLNNLLGETILLSHLAMRAKRAFVFHDYIVQDHTRYPLNAWLSGPTAGSAWPSDVDAPRSVGVAYWGQVCPASRRKVLDPAEVNKQLGVDFQTTRGDTFMDKWADYLLGLPDNCVELKDGTHQLFDIFFFGRDDLLTLWPQISKSPVMTHFAFSAPVQDAVARNMRLISPSSPATPWQGTASGISRSTTGSSTGIQRLVAAHIRRGDFLQHCTNLHGWGAGFASWNLLKDLPDKFKNRAPKEEYLKKCLPDIRQIVERLHEVRAQHDQREGAGHELENVFIMTNGERAWINQLAVALQEDGWRTVTSSKDLVLDQVEAKVDAAVDMEIARRAEVFLGNGFSTLTATVTALRLTLEWAPQNIRFL